MATASQTLSAVEGWLQSGRPHGTALQAFVGPEPKLVKGENGLLDAIENRRRRVRELRADLNRISFSPHPSGFCKQKMREQVEALALRGAPDCSILVEHGGEITWPSLTLTAMVHNATPAHRLRLRSLKWSTLPHWWHGR